MIWLIGGTSESRQVATFLNQAGLPWVATVVSDRARRLYAGGQVVVGAFAVEAIAPFLQSYAIRCIVDASHPFAVEISQQAIATGLPYLRLERPSPTLAPAVVRVPEIMALWCDRYLLGRRVLLTLGVKALTQAVLWCDRAELWARILPTEASWAAAQQAGFPENRLIPMQLPVTLEQERSLWRSLRVDTVMTKAAGEAGGLSIKQQVAQELGVTLVVVDRPAIAYPRQTSEIGEIPAWCQQWLRASQPYEEG